MNNALKRSVDIVLRIATKEDKTKEDITTKFLLNSKKIKMGVFFKETGVLCGKGIVNQIVKKINKDIQIRWNYKEGEEIKKGSTVAIISGPGNIIVSNERVILNFLQKLCGIATLTRLFVKKLDNKKIKILDTRKTIPGWRHLEKYAVEIGGGKNHRTDLAESILIKDNHIKISGDIDTTLRKVFKNKRKKKVEVEASSIKDVKKIIGFQINQIMLDNFKEKDIPKATKIIRESSSAKIEVSGNINLKNIKSMGKYDIDFISIGRITHSAQFLDISMDVLR